MKQVEFGSEDFPVFGAGIGAGSVLDNIPFAERPVASSV
jgi:hypothetical protein